MAPEQCLQVDSGDVQLAVNIHGDANSPTLVLVHGYPDCSDVWRGMVPLLSQRFRVVTYDVRGTGRSTAPQSTQDYALERLAADFRAVLDAVSPDQPVHLVAHDWGAVQSWESVTDPQLQARIKSFSSVSGPCLDHVGFWMRDALQTLSPKDLAAVSRQVLGSWYVWFFQLPGLAPLLWKTLLGQNWHRMLASRQGVVAQPSATQERDGVNGIALYRANIGRLANPQQRATSLPVQLIIPVNDDFVSPPMARDSARPWVENLWCREVSTGHWMPLSHPQLLAKMVTEFVDFREGQPETAALKRARAGKRDQFLGGKLAIVTGAGSGIGRETLLALARAGAEVVAADINQAAAEESAQLAWDLGAVAHSYKVDVGNAKAMEKFANWVQQQLGAPDIVVNNAGIGMAGKFLDTHIADWEKILHVNLWGVIHGSRLFARQMVDAAIAGTIVNVSSGLGYMPSRMLPAYATTKAAVLMLNDCIRAELADDSIHVVSVCPGVIDTPITRATLFVGVDSAEQERRRDSAKKLYQRRNLPPRAVADAIMRAIRKRKDEVPVGIEARVGRWITYVPGMARRLAKMDVKM